MLHVQKRLASTTLRVVKTGVLGAYKAFNNVHTHLGKESVKKLKRYNMKIEEESEWDSTDSSMTVDTKFVVGDLNQYPNGAHENMCKFAEQHLTTLQPLSDWKSDNATKEALLDVSITSAVDYYPFPITFPQKIRSNQKNKGAANQWWRVDNVKYGNLEDSWGNDMILLERSLSKTKRQYVLIYRDTHTDMKGIEKIERVIQQFHPNKIVFEYPAEGPSLAVIPTMRFKIAAAILKLRQQYMDPKRSATIGARAHWQWLLWAKSFAISRATQIAAEQGISIVLADYNTGTRRLLTEVADAFDVYSGALWVMLDFPVRKLRELANSASIPPNFINLITLKSMPHFGLVASWRNDMMALTVNECTEQRVLFVCGMAHAVDVMDRLTGKVEIPNLFKAVSDKTVELKHMNRSVYGGNTRIKLSDHDAAILTKQLGAEAVDLLTLTNEDLNDRLLTKLAEKFNISRESLLDQMGAKSGSPTSKTL